MGKTEKMIPFPEDARLIIPASFNDCLTYGEQVRFLYEMVVKLQDRVQELEEKVNQ